MFKKLYKRAGKRGYLVDRLVQIFHQRKRAASNAKPKAKWITCGSCFTQNWMSLKNSMPIFFNARSRPLSACHQTFERNACHCWRFVGTYKDRRRAQKPVALPRNYPGCEETSLEIFYLHKWLMPSDPPWDLIIDLHAFTRDETSLLCAALVWSCHRLIHRRNLKCNNESPQ